MFTGSAILFVFIVLTQKCDNALGTYAFSPSRENVLLSMTKVHAAVRRCINDKRKKTSNVCLKWNLDYTQWLHYNTSINYIGYRLYGHACMHIIIVWRYVVYKNWEISKSSRSYRYLGYVATNYHCVQKCFLHAWWKSYKGNHMFISRYCCLYSFKIYGMELMISNSLRILRCVYTI